MTLKTLVHPITGQTFKMGRIMPKLSLERKMHLPFGNYLDRAKLPEPPVSTNYKAKAMDCLKQVMLNDQLGDCTAAAAFHIEGVLLGNAGNPVTFSDEQVREFYSLSTGYVAGNADTDQGGNEITVLDTWRTRGLIQGRRKILGHVVIDSNDVHQIKTALWLGENLYFGISLPEAYVSPMPEASGFVWNVAGDPIPSNGHAFAGVDYDATGVDICTWGMIGKLTYEAIAKYCAAHNGGELHMAISADSLDKASKRAPNGLDIDALLADFRALGGSV